MVLFPANTVNGRTRHEKPLLLYTCMSVDRRIFAGVSLGTCFVSPSWGQRRGTREHTRLLGAARPSGDISPSVFLVTESMVLVSAEAAQMPEGRVRTPYTSCSPGLSTMTAVTVVLPHILQTANEMTSGASDPR